MINYQRSYFGPGRNIDENSPVQINPDLVTSSYTITMPVMREEPSSSFSVFRQGVNYPRVFNSHPVLLRSGVAIGVDGRTYPKVSYFNQLPTIESKPILNDAIVDQWQNLCVIFQTEFSSSLNPNSDTENFHFALMDYSGEIGQLIGFDKATLSKHAPLGYVKLWGDNMVNIYFSPDLRQDGKGMLFQGALLPRFTP